MASFSRDTFATHRIERLKHYVSVRMQQGVPLVDADWNEMDDIRKYELRTFLKWFVGDGIPQQNNDAFRIVATPAANDFIIKGGDGTWQGAARCLVDGWEVFLPNDLQYTAQELYRNDPLAEAWDVPPLLELVEPWSPGGAPSKRPRTDTVYLDVWERPVDSQEDSALNNEAIGIETSVRMKREWVVRVAVDASEPPAPPPGHAYYALARLDRRAREQVIPTERITDLRRTGLTLMSQHDITQITKDAFGEPYPLDQTGTPQFKISLRDAVNALIAGEIPTTKEVVLAESCDAWAVLQDSLQDVWLIWDSQSTAVGVGLYCQRYQSGQVLDSVYLAERESDETISNLQLVEDDKKNIWVFWEQRKGADTTIMYRCYVRNAPSPWQPIEEKATSPYTYTMLKVAVKPQGNVWIFWLSDENGQATIKYGWYNGKTWVEGAVAESGPSASGLEVLSETAGGIWLFWSTYQPPFGETRAKSKIHGCHFDQNQGSWSLPKDIEFTPYHPLFGPGLRLVEEHNGSVWVFWTESENDICYTTILSENDEWTKNRLTEDVDNDRFPVPVVDRAGQLWVFWRRYRDGYRNIWYKRKVGATFGADAELTVDIKSDDLFLATNIFLDSRGDIWVFWEVDNQIWYRRYTSKRGWGRATALTKDVRINSNPAVNESMDGTLWVMWKQRTTPGGSADVMYKELVLAL